jgi:hypothetical protein
VNGGTQILDLNGSGPGEIEQSGISTTPGHWYQISFVPYPNTTSARLLIMDVYWNNAFFDQISVTIPDNGPIPNGNGSYIFEATGNDSLKFKSRNSGTAGLMLDDVTLTEVPIATPLTPRPLPVATDDFTSSLWSPLTSMARSGSRLASSTLTRTHE